MNKRQQKKRAKQLDPFYGLKAAPKVLFSGGISRKLLEHRDPYPDYQDPTVRSPRPTTTNVDRPGVAGPSKNSP